MALCLAEADGVSLQPVPRWGQWNWEQGQAQHPQ